MTAGRSAHHHPERPVLWPEHFDIGVLVDGMGYGVSPGDRYISEPYAYATPRGAARPIRDLGSADPDAALAFFTDARRRGLLDGPPPSRTQSSKTLLAAPSGRRPGVGL